MPNTRSAKKAVRSSGRKRQVNMILKKGIKTAVRSLQDKLNTKGTGVDILNKELTVLQKVLDKAAKINVIHKNKANRLKSRYAQRIAAQTGGKTEKTASKASSAKGATRGARREQKSKS